MAPKIEDYLKYDPTTGTITVIKAYGKRKLGVTVGSLRKDGYLNVVFFGKNYLAHRLCWFLYYGVWPEEIDHRNRVRSDNKLLNLREASSLQNKGNTSVRKHSQIPFKGVSFAKGSKKPYRARIQEKLLGNFDTPEEAYKAYQKAALEIYGEFADG